MAQPSLSMPTSTLDISNTRPHHRGLTCWLLDTRRLWPGTNITTATAAAEALSLISAPEQTIVREKMFIQDARMSLGSALLKRLYISQTLGLEWEDVRLGRKGDEKHGKPCAVDSSGRPIEGLDFNVSHQAGLVALIGYISRSGLGSENSSVMNGTTPSSGQVDDVLCGVDIVCVNERDDYRTIDSEGFDSWIDIYDSIFSGEERWSMKYDVDYITLNDGTTLQRDELGRHDRCIDRDKHIKLTTAVGQDVSFPSELIVEAKLRRFYAYFCYKEAYIKLAGEALLAPWLKQLEFFNVRSPRSMPGTWGEEVDDVEVSLHGKRVQDVRMKIQAFEVDFMLATAIQGEIQELEIPAFEMLDLQEDVLASTLLTRT